MGHREQEDAQWPGTLYDMLCVEVIEYSIILSDLILQKLYLNLMCQ